MIVTIIGSYSRKEAMEKCKDFWEERGCIVNCPCDPEREHLSLFEKQSSWIERIKEANLVVAIPKIIVMMPNGASEYRLDIGESTSYELAIAHHFDKQVIFWKG